MKSNVGGIDRSIRIVIGLVLIGLAATGTVGLVGMVGVAAACHWLHRLVSTVRPVWLEHLRDEKIDLKDVGRS